MMAQKPRELGCRGKERRKSLTTSIIRAARSDVDGVSSGASPTHKGASCIACVVESLHELAIDNNEMHEHGVSSEVDAVSCGGKPRK